MAFRYVFILALLVLIQLSSMGTALAADIHQTDKERGSTFVSTTSMIIFNLQVTPRNDHVAKEPGVTSVSTASILTSSTQVTPATNAAQVIGYTISYDADYGVFTTILASRFSHPTSYTTLPLYSSGTTSPSPLPNKLDPHPTTTNDAPGSGGNSDTGKICQPYSGTPTKWHEANWVKIATYIFVTFDCLSLMLLAFLLTTGRLDWGLNLYPYGAQNPTQARDLDGTNSNNQNRAARHRNNRPNRNDGGRATGNNASSRAELTNDAYELADIASHGFRQRQDNASAAASRNLVVLHPQGLQSTETVLGGNSDEERERIVDVRTERMRRLAREWDVEDAREDERDVSRLFALAREQEMLDVALRRAGMM